jgi:hypothetical protein
MDLDKGRSKAYKYRNSQDAKIQPQTISRPFHGCDRGSNPRGDATSCAPVRISFVTLCKREKFQGFPIFRSILRPEILKFGIAIRRRFPVSFNDLRTLRGFEVLWAIGCKFSGDEGLLGGILDDSNWDGV